MATNSSLSSAELRRVAEINALDDLRDVAAAGAQLPRRRRERLAVFDAERWPQVDRGAHEPAQQVGLSEPEDRTGLLEPREILRREIRLNAVLRDVGFARSGQGDPLFRANGSGGAPRRWRTATAI